VKQAATLGKNHKLKLIAEFNAAYGTVLSKTGQLRSRYYCNRLFNRALAVLKACFKDEAEFNSILKENRLISKLLKPKRQYVFVS